MSTYITRKLELQVAEKQNGTNLIFERSGNSVKFSADANLGEAEMLKYTVAIPATDTNLMEGSTITTGRILYLETDVELTVKLNSASDTGFTVKPVVDATATTSRGLLYLEGVFTALYITIAGTSGGANLVVGIVGE